MSKSVRPRRGAQRHRYATVDDLKKRIGIHVPKLDMLPAPHPQWDDLPVDVRALLAKIVEVDPKNPHLVLWANHAMPQHQWRSFVNVHLPEMGWGAARADRALARAAELRLVIRPNVAGGPLWWEGVGLIWGDFVYVTALGHKLVTEANETRAAHKVTIDIATQTINVDGKTVRCGGSTTFENFVVLWEARPHPVDISEKSGRRGPDIAKDVRDWLRRGGLVWLAGKLRCQRGVGYYFDLPA